MSMLNTTNPAYRASLPHIKFIRKQISHFCGSLDPVGHYTEPRVYGGMTKYWKPRKLNASNYGAIMAIIRSFNKNNPGWTAKCSYGEAWKNYNRSASQLVIHVNKTK